MLAEPSNPNQRGGVLPAALIAGLVICVIVAGAIVLMSRHTSAPQHAATQNVKLPFGPAERAYTPNIHFTKIKLAKAENFLGEEFTYVQFSVTNAGTQDIHGLSIQLEF